MEKIEVTDTKKKKTAIDAPRGTFFWLSPSDPRLKVVGVDTKHGPEHPLYSERNFRNLSEESIRNIGYFGVRQNIVVKEEDYEGEKCLLVVAGNGRVRRARVVEAEQIKAGISPTIRIPVVLDKGHEGKDLIALAGATNVFDAEDPTIRARDAQRMIDMGASIEEVATSKGVSTQTVRNWQSLLELAPKVIQQVISGEVTGTAAIQLAVLPKEEQATTLEEIKKEGGKVTVERTRAKANEKAGRTTTDTPKAKLEKIAKHLFKLSGMSNPSKDELLSTLDKICRLATGHTLEKLGDIGD